MRLLKCSKGATTAETLMLAPFYFFLVFGVLQLGHLAIAMLAVNYAASAVVRQAIVNNVPNGNYSARMGKFMLAGMQKPFATAESDGEGLMTNVRVYACAEVDAFPLIGNFLGGVLSEKLGSATSSSCSSIHRFAFNPEGGGRFVVQATAKGRMNMTPRP